MNPGSDGSTDGEKRTKPSMKITINRIGRGLIVVQMTGRFHIEGVQNFDRAISELFEESPKSIALNMEGLSYIDSSGIGALVKVMNISKNRGIDLVITDLNKEILHIFKLASLDRFFTISTHKEITARYS